MPALFATWAAPHSRSVPEDALYGPSFRAGAGKNVLTDLAPVHRFRLTLSVARVAGVLTPGKVYSRCYRFEMCVKTHP